MTLLLTSIIRSRLLCCLLHGHLLTTTLLHDILHLKRSSCSVYVGSSAGTKFCTSGLRITDPTCVWHPTRVTGVVRSVLQQHCLLLHEKQHVEEAVAAPA